MGPQLRAERLGERGELGVRRHGPAERTQSSPAELVLSGGRGIGGQLQHGFADLLGGEDGLQAVDERVAVDALARRVARDPDRADAARRGELGQQRDEPDAQPRPLGLVGGVPAQVADGGLGAGVPAAERRPGQRGAAGHRDHRAARRQRLPQRRSDPGEGVPGVGVPVAAEGVPRLLVDRRHVRRAPRVEHQQAGTVVVEHGPRKGLVGGVADQRREGVAELGVHRAQVLLAAGDADHGVARGDQCGGDRAPEAAAGPGDDGGGWVRHGNSVRWRCVPIETRARRRNPSPGRRPVAVRTGEEPSGGR